jgi:hypothetical protein
LKKLLIQKLALRRIGYGPRNSGWRNEFPFSEIKATISEPFLTHFFKNASFSMLFPSLLYSGCIHLG